MLAKQSWESWGTGSLSAPAIEIRASKGKKKKKKHLQKSVSHGPKASPMSVLGVLVVIPLPQCRRVYFVCWLVYCSISLASEGGTLSTRRNIDFIDSNPGVSAATAGAQDFIERFIGRFISVSERASGGTR